MARDISQRIDRMQDRLKDREAALLRQFSVLEQTLGRLKGQSGGVLDQLANLPLTTSQTAAGS